MSFPDNDPPDPDAEVILVTIDLLLKLHATLKRWLLNCAVLHYACANSTSCIKHAPTALTLLSA